MNKKVIYAGLHEETLPLLYKAFRVSAVAHIDFFCNKTLNPINLIFKSVYFLRRREKFRVIEIILLKLWELTNNFSSSVFYKYRNYLELISQNKTKVLNFNSATETENYIKNNQVDLIVINTWDILPDSIIFSPKLGTINIHPSKLPQYRGALPTLWSLKNKDFESAISYMLLDKSMDGGKILRQCVFKLDKLDNWLSIEKKATEVIRETLVDTLAGYIEGRIIPFAQDDSIVSFTEKYERYKKIDWESEKGEDIYNKINLYPFVIPNEFCYTYFKGKIIYLKGAEFIKNEFEEVKHGKFFILGRNLCIKLKDGVVKLKLFSHLDFFSSIIFIFQRHKINFDSKK